MGKISFGSQFGGFQYVVEKTQYCNSHMTVGTCDRHTADEEAKFKARIPVMECRCNQRLLSLSRQGQAREQTFKHEPEHFQLMNSEAQVSSMEESETGHCEATVTSSSLLLQSPGHLRI